MIINTNILGCKVNYADAQALLPALARLSSGPAQLVATCCVTAEAEKQSRKEVRRALRRAGESGKVFVTGCASRRDPAAFSGLGANVEVMSGEAPAAAGADRPWEAGALDAGSGAGAQTAAAAGRTRFFLKIQDGCLSGCAYCVIPQVRGKPHSTPMAEVVKSARSAVAAGFPELVVTGINVGQWRDGAARLPVLLETLAGIDGLRRLRLSSIEPRGVTERLLEVIQRHPLIGRHLHVPLQSGDDGVLASMGRRYTGAGFARAIETARAAVPDINITTDVIVGFPTEDGAAFANTLALVTGASISKVHVFSYSARPGTRAADLDDHVPPPEKKRRSLELRQLSGSLLKAHHERKLGSLSEILLESAQGGGSCSGYSSDYTRFIVAGGSPGDMVTARAEAVTEDAVKGTVMPDE